MIGKQVHHYQVTERLGAGGMGEVYLGHDTKLNRSVAIKFLPANLAGDAEFTGRFLHEAQATAALNHSNIVTVHDVGEFEGRPYIVMERLEGQTLQDAIKEGNLSLENVLEIVRQILAGLSAAHKIGIVHRDIKPANLFLTTEGVAKILDFGLAKSHRASTETRVGTTLGTVQYESPEQSRGEAVDQRSDLFSLGVVVYEMISGRLPFAGDYEAAIRYAISHEAHEPLARYKAGVSEGLERFVGKLLEKDADLRYQDAPGALSDLMGLAKSDGKQGARAPQPLNKKALALAGGALLVTAALTVVVIKLFTGAAPQVASGETMLVVLPFENLGPTEDDYFAAGITEEITSRLAQINRLGVISRTSAVAASLGKLSLKEIGEQLGVEYVLEGTIRWSIVADTPRVRITPQLIRVVDDRHVWADNYERKLMEVFAVQSDIAEKIVDQLGITLADSTSSPADEPPTANEHAYKLYLRALHFVRQTKRDTYDMKAESLLDSVVELDPEFAQAHALRSEVYSERGFGSPGSFYARTALESAERALELQPDLPQARLALGWYYNRVETNYDRAMDEFLIAQSRLPNDAELQSAIAFVWLRRGEWEKAASGYRRAVELDPLNPLRHAQLAECYKVMRNFEESIKSIDRAIAQRPDYWLYHTNKIYITRNATSDVGRLKQVVFEAMDSCGTQHIAWQTWALSAYIPELNWDSISVAYAEINRNRDYLEDVYYSRNYYQYGGLCDSVRMRAYADSLRPYLEAEYNGDPQSPTLNSNFGLLLARMGECERAIELGKRGKELMSIDECHY